MRKISEVASLNLRLVRDLSDAGPRGMQLRSWRAPLDNIYFRDYRGTFAISYKQNRKGRLLNFREGTDTRYRFDFPESGEIVNTDTLSDIDERLLAIFMTRVEELG